MKTYSSRNIFRHLRSAAIMFAAAIIIAGSTTACIEEFNEELPSSESRLLVVEGAILSDTICNFYLSESVPIGHSSMTPIPKNAKLKIVSSEGEEYNMTGQESNNYQIKTPKLKADVKYSLHIEYDGNKYESTPQHPIPTLPIESVDGNQKDKDSDIDVLITTASPANPKETQYFRWLYEETWEVRPELITNVVYDPEKNEGVPCPNPYPERGWISYKGSDIIASSSAYYQNNKIAGYKLYDIKRDSRRLYVLYSTNVIQRAITKAEYEYELARRQVSSEMGGLFTPQPSALPSNIICTTDKRRVIGYVGCSLNVATKRIFIEPSDFNIRIIKSPEIKKSTDDGFPGNMSLYESGWKLCSWIDQRSMGGQLEAEWTRQVYLDVRQLGASTIRPDFWPEGR